MDEMNKVINILQQQRTVIDNLTVVTRSIAAHVNDLATRLHLEQLPSMPEAHWTANIAFNTRNTTIVSSVNKAK